MRVVLDTNVLFSALATPIGTPGRIFDAWHQGQFEYIVSSYIIDELRFVVQKKLPREFAASEVIIRNILILAIVVEPENIEVSGVLPNDWPILGTARAGNAKLLVTGDKLLLRLQSYYGTSIVTPAEFLKIQKLYD